MANKNLNKLRNYANRYGVSFQPLYTKDAIEKGNLEVVHNAIIGGKKYTCLQQYNNESLENLFKGIASGHDRIHAPENTVIFNKNSETVSINGRVYDLFEIVKDMDTTTLSQMLAKYLSYGESWQREFALKLRQFLKDDGYAMMIEYRYIKEYGVEEYKKVMGIEA